MTQNPIVTADCQCQDNERTACNGGITTPLAINLACPGEYRIVLCNDCEAVTVDEPPVEEPPVEEPPIDLNPDKPFDPALLAKGARLNDFTETVGQRLVVAGRLKHEGQHNGWLVRFSPDYSEVYQKKVTEGITEIDHCVAVGNNMIATNHNRAVLLDANFNVLRGRELQGIDIRDIAATSEALYFSGIAVTGTNLHPPVLARLPYDLAQDEVPAIRLVSGISNLFSLLRPLSNGGLVAVAMPRTLMLFSPDLEFKQAVELPDIVACVEIDPQGRIYIGTQHYLLQFDNNLNLLNGLQHELSNLDGLCWQNGQLYARYITTSRGEQPAGTKELIQLQVDCASMTLSGVQLTGRIDDANFIEDIKASGHLSNGDRVVVGYRSDVPWGLANDQPLLSDASAWQHSTLDPLDFHTFPASPALTPVELTFEPTTVTLSDYEIVTREPVLDESAS